MSPDTAVSGGTQLRSASLPWVRFTWDAASVPELLPSAEPHLIRPASKEELEKVTEVILNSLSLDSAWNASFARVEQHLKDAAQRLFSQDASLCLVIPKGNRLIAASLLDIAEENPSQLLSGPMVLSEYRNRGIGTQLLHASLAALSGRGYSVVTGVTRANTVCARHVYTKFGGVGEPVPQPFMGAFPREEKELNQRS